MRIALPRGLVVLVVGPCPSCCTWWTLATLGNPLSTWQGTNRFCLAAVMWWSLAFSLVSVCVLRNTPQGWPALLRLSAVSTVVVPPEAATLLHSSTSHHPVSHCSVHSLCVFACAYVVLHSPCPSQLLLLLVLVATCVWVKTHAPTLLVCTAPNEILAVVLHSLCGH